MIESGTRTHNLLGRVCRATDDDRLSTRQTDTVECETDANELHHSPSLFPRCLAPTSYPAYCTSISCDIWYVPESERRRLCAVSVWRADISIVAIIRMHDMTYGIHICIGHSMEIGSRCEMLIAAASTSAIVQATLFKINWIVVGGADSQITYVLNMARITVTCSCPVSMINSKVDMPPNRLKNKKANHCELAKCEV